MRDLEIPGTQTAVSNTHYKSFVFFSNPCFKKGTYFLSTYFKIAIHMLTFFVTSYNQFC